jgi:hypothetical protein
MHAKNRNSDIQLRLTEMNRRSAKLFAVSSKLADMAAQLAHLRKVNERFGVFTNRSSLSNRRQDDSLLCKYLGDSRRRIQLSRKHG